MQVLKLIVIFIVMLVLSYFDLTQSILFDFKSFIPTLFFSVAALLFTFRLTIISTFTEKLPKRDEVKNKMIQFNSYLSNYIIWTISYGVLGVLLSKFCKDIDINSHAQLLKYMPFTVVQVLILIGRATLLTTLCLTLYKFIKICIITQDLAKLYIMKSFDTDE